MDRPTGENLFAEDDFDYIPGASVFYKFDDTKVNNEEYVPGGGLPSNPQDYLRSVMFEAQNCPDVVVASINPEKLRKQDRPAYVSLVSKPLPGSEHAPTKNWCYGRISSFCYARDEYMRHLAHLKSIKRQTKRRPKLPIYPLPPWDDELNWRYLCLGNKIKEIVKKSELPDTSPISEIEYDDEVMDALAACGKSNLDKNDEDEHEEETEDRVVDLSTLEEGFQPMLRILLRMEQKQIESNLEYHTQWMKIYGFTTQQGRWIYALLTCLEKPLFPTVISTLRDLSRQCAVQRGSKEPGSEEMNGLNVIICIVGKYFDQSDLLDPI